MIHHVDREIYDAAGYTAPGWYFWMAADRIGPFPTRERAEVVYTAWATNAVSELRRHYATRYEKSP